MHLGGLLAGLLVALVGCRSVHAPPRPTPFASASSESREHTGSVRPANAAELAHIEGLMRQAETLRGLRFVRPVRVTIEDGQAMRAYVERTLEQSALERARRRYVALGALDPSIDVHALLVSIMEEELIGYYDPIDKHLAVRADIARALRGTPHDVTRSATWRATVVHELVHALQDQHFDLQTAVKASRTTDEDNAFGALVEGDATLVTLGYLAQPSGTSLGDLASQPERILGMLTRPPDELSEALRRAPALLRDPLLFRYREGALFCAALVRSGGWQRVDAAHRSPPRSTRTIRAPRTYGAREEPPLARPSLGFLRDLGLHEVDEDVLGALELGIFLAASGRDVSAITRAWRGDRYVVLQHGDALGSLWWLRFTSPHTARRAEAAFDALAAPERHVRRVGPMLLVAHDVAPAVFEAASAQLESTARMSAVEPARARRAEQPDIRGYPLASTPHRN